MFWYYNKFYHGRGPIDGVGDTIKHRVFRDVKSGKVSIKNVKYFTVFAGSILEDITSLYMLIEEVLEEPENIDRSASIRATLEIHKIARTFATDGICKMEFHQITLDEKLLSNGTKRMGTKMFVVTEKIHYPLTLILHVLSAMEFMQQIKNDWSNATIEISGSMNSVFSFKNS